MPNACAAYGCNNRFGPDTKQKRITFHLLPPPTDVRRKLWIGNSRRIDPVTRKPWDPTSKYVYFCSDHFMPSDFDNNIKNFGRRLKENAVPTVFTFPTSLTSSPESQSSAAKSGNEEASDDGLAKGKPISRLKRSKQRKVVMLPKKIKLLQETSASNVESVTIISFQHLDYNEKLQPIFEKAMLDLQYPEESEGELDEEYYEDQYTELKDTLPLEEEEAQMGVIPPEEIQDPESTELCEDLPPQKSMQTVSKSTETADIVYSESVMQVDSVPEETISLTEEVPQDSEERNESDKPEETVSVEVPKRTQSSTKNGVRPEPLKSVSNDDRTIMKKRIPVVIKEISLIDDIEELRIKAFRIAEDNVKLKRQVIYLEQKLEELVSQEYVK